MINLIPAEAKKYLVREYWMRSVTVWFFLWAFTLVLGIALLFPSYVLVNLQVKAYQESADTASAKNANYEAVAKELEKASEIAVTLSEQFAQPTMTEYLQLIRSFEAADVAVERIVLNRESNEINTIIVLGTADSRQALAAFRNRMLDNERIETVDLPISNMAKDRDIPFELTVTLTKEKTP